MPCSLDSFFDLFVSDTAKYSVPALMKESGDEDIQCSAWKMDDDGVTKSRIIEYTHPVHAPMAPPMARARKEQSYRRYGEHGIVLETKTYVSDVPMTDCFYVADIVRVETNGNKDSVSMSMHFDIRFVKSTMFRSIITRTTKGEFEKFMQRLANFMTEQLSGGEVTPISILKKPEVAVAPISPAASFVSTILPILMTVLLFFVILLQTWILMEMNTMKQDLRSLQANECAAPR